MIQDLTGARLIALFFTALVLLNYPMLSLFNNDLALLAIPILYVYIFTVWCLVIGLIILAARFRQTDRRGRLENDRD